MEAVKKPKLKSIKAHMRQALMERFGMRGHHYSNIWIFYSAKTDRDWAVSSDLEFDFAIWAESNPEIAGFDLNPPEVMVKVGDDDCRTRFDAIVRYVSGRLEATEVKYSYDQGREEGARTARQRAAQKSAAERDGMTYRRISEVDLAPHQMTIVNWRRVVAFLAAVRVIDITAEREMVAIKLSASPEGITLGELLDGVDEARHPAMLAAVFRLVQQGLYEAELDTRPLSLESRVTPKQARV